jgi:hypothetical protein
MAEEVKIIFEIEGIQKSVSSVEELQAALKGVETQSKKTEKTVDDVAEAATKVGKNSEEAAKNAEGATKIVDEAFGGLGTKVKEVGGGMLQLGKSAVTSFKSAVMGANAMGKALIATGIGAIVVALGLIAAYWDDIVGAISGVSSEQTKLLEDTKAEVAARQDSLDSLLASENSLKLSGKSEKEIRDLKIQQTNETIAAMETQLTMQRQQSKAQVEALERNATIAQNVIRFLTAPVTILLKAVDALTAGLAKVGVLEKGTNLEESFSGGLAGLIFDPEGAKTTADETEKEITKGLEKLKNTRDGYILQGRDADKKAADTAKADAAKTAEEKLAIEKELIAELEKLRAENILDAEQKAQALLEIARQAARQELVDKQASAELLLEFDRNYALQKQAITDEFAAKAEEKRLADEAKAAENRAIIDEVLKQQELDSMENQFRKAEAELELQRQTDIEKITLAGATAEEIAKINGSYTEKAKKLAAEELKFKKALKNQEINDALNASSQVLGSIVSLVGEGSAVGKAAAVAQATIDTYTSATAAYSSVVGVPFVGPVLAPIAAGVAVAAGIMNVKKILSTKTPGGRGGGGGPVPTAPSIPSGPPIDPNAALAANTANQEAQNQITLGDQQGSTGATVIKAYVVSTDMSSQQEADRKINDLARL